MKPLLITLCTGRKLLVLPDTKVHSNGHVVITDTYSLFNDTGLAQPRLQQVKEKDMHREDNCDPDYVGYLRIEVPDKLFTYVAPDHIGLETGEVEELIEWLTEVRSRPELWPL